MAAAHASFLRACQLDVAVRKPGNVSVASPGHGMLAAQFIASALAAVGPLLAPGVRVGARIDTAGAASWAAAGCTTPLGILLLCAPLAAAAERCPPPCSAAALHGALQSVLGDLDIDDAHAAFRAIHRANPGGLGQADAQDVRSAPSVNLRQAMALAAGRDSIALQYSNGYAELFGLALPGLPPGLLALPAARGAPAATAAAAPAATAAAVQRVYLALLAQLPDSHIVRKHGPALAHTVMKQAQAWWARARAGEPLHADAGFAAWDSALKQQRINPGTSADLTVAALFAAGLLAGPASPPAAKPTPSATTRATTRATPRATPPPRRQR